MNGTAKFLLGLLFFTSLMTNIILICMFARKAAPGRNSCSPAKGESRSGGHSGRDSVFADLTAAEHDAVKRYVMTLGNLNVTDDPWADPTKNFLFLIDLHLPRKEETHRYLEGVGDKPPREAIVVLFRGSQARIEEYVVGPLPEPTYHRDVTVEKYGRYPPFSSRPISNWEYDAFLHHVYQKELSKVTTILEESFGGAADKFYAIESQPKGFRSGRRETWLSFCFAQPGYFLQPMGFEIFLDHSDANVSQWEILKVLYNGQYFDSLEDLKEKYEQGHVKRVTLQGRKELGTLMPRTKTASVPPLQVDLRGRRYTLDDNRVQYLNWSFDFGLSLVHGFRVFDAQFAGQRVAYEVSVQGVASVYGTSVGAAMLTKSLDMGFAMGSSAHELVRGVDCPYLATYMDTYQYVQTNSTRRVRNSICIFEHSTGHPLRRHLTNYISVGYGGLANSVLVVRTITDIGNYDYIWDFMFYQNGAMEVKVFATGYVLTTYLTEGSLQYGHRVAANAVGNIHTHFISFKVDLDIAGTNNYFLTKDMAYHEVQVPWSPERRVQVPKLVEKQLKTENEAALRFDQKIPRYLHIASNKTNKWGHNRSYRIQVLSFNGDHLPESVPEEAAVSWARYKVAITKHKDHESTSSSLYNQNDMWSPAVNFSSYINGESIENEDLVAWISTGFLHIPHAEDIPNTVTAGNGGGFFLRPHNYFDEDPSINSPDSVYLDPSIPSDSCELNPNACLQNEVCMPNLPAFTYNGFDEVIHI
ncbi:retina-specific copper amine oxidase isoform X2 [Erpetoichthys calabaricus]|uniref:retina-specific copper amine oxidase isoform X2 n=1 Tax=Erpetoichthys calabaricus TaxID=27687 RepID=UPI0022340A32|nr:retina-specific copper amine oxidase isoform X2 [Erpetoichthys calabaricus]